MKSEPSFHLDWLQIEISALCNRSCPYCAATCLGRRREAGLMDMHTFERLRPSFSSVGLVYLQGWGEPLLHPELWAMIRQAKAAGAMTGFTTNASLLDRDCARQLIRSEVDILAVSLAGTTPATHEGARPGCDLARIDEALSTLRELKLQQGVQNPRVHIAFLLLRSNWREVGGLVAMADRWGAAQVVVSNLTWIGAEALQAESLLMNSALWPEVTRALEQARREGAGRGIEFFYRGPEVRKPCATCSENVLKACFVSHSGDVSPCVFASLAPPSGEPAIHFREGRALPMQRLIFGNVRNRTLPEIWDSEPARSFRQSFQKRLAMASPGTSHLPQLCRTCYKLFDQ